MMTEKTLTALMPHRNHGSYFVEDCPHCAAGKRIEELEAHCEEVQRGKDEVYEYYHDLATKAQARLDAVEAAAKRVVDDPVQINLQRLEQALEQKDGRD